MCSAVAAISWSNDDDDGCLPGRADDTSTVLVPVVDSVRLSSDDALKDRLTTSRLCYAAVWQTDLR